MKKDKYIICCDLDDTLLRSDKTISDYTKQKINEICLNGNYFVMNSGRPYQGMSDFIERLELKDMPVSCYNGAAIVFPDISNLKKYNSIVFSIKKDLFRQLYVDVKNLLDACMASSLKRVYFFNKSHLPSFIIHINDLVEEKNGNIDDFLEDDILTATFQVKEKDLNVFKREILKDEYKSLSFFSWGIYEGIATFEVSLNIATKGHALKYLAKIFDIPEENTIAFGDAENDLSMLNDANEGVFMCNSKDSVIHLGKHFTYKTSDEDGVVDYLEKMHPELWK